MPKPFVQLDPRQLAAVLARYPFTRAVREVHVHHTGSPRDAGYTGAEIVEEMWRHHTQTQGWSDIAQHLTVMRDGSLWTGRGWNRAPVPASGFGGDAKAGPFMVALTGGFGAERDPLAGEQSEAAAEVVARVQLRFGLPAGAFRFDRAGPCPGDAVSREEMLRAVERAREKVLAEGDAFATRDLPFDSSALHDDPANDAGVTAALDSLITDPMEEAMHAEEHGHPLDAEPAPVRGGEGLGEGTRERGGRPFTAEVRRRLRPHVVNLSMGRLSSDGVMRTTEEDVRALFGEHIPAFLRAHPGARIVFHAHGGLVDEEAGLWAAHDQLGWWMANGVYPVFFVWETGLLPALAQLFRGRAGAERGVVDEWVTDPAIEAIARALGGPKIWSGMKRSAELASREGGGARLAATCLAELLRSEVARGVEVHAVGHSAGAIFHSHFVPAALEAGVERFASLSLLAPALRVGSFLERLEPRVGPGRGVERLAVFTMADDYELADSCVGVYRKSLLYLIHHALEAERREAILGLEVSVRADARLRAFFGLDGAAGEARGEVLWSVTGAAAPGRSATRSATHADFDDDAATMESVLRRVLGRGDAEPVVPFPERAERTADGARPEGETVLPASIPAAAPVPTSSPSPVVLSHRAARRALCVGINAYPGRAELFGCVRDAELWARTLRGMDFEVTMLHDGDATREGILRELERLVRSGEPGDVLAFQYSGHGIQLPDLDGDEESGMDQALVPVDFRSGAYVLDDEQFGLFQTLREGVALTCFYDCCHSGTMARLMDSFRSGTRGVEDEGPRIRCLEPDAAMIAAFRAARGATRGTPRELRERSRSRAVAFSACRDHEPALERNGHGVFTRAATSLLASAAGALPTHEAFHRQVLDALSAESQRPQLDCRDEAAALPLLSPLGETDARAPRREAEAASAAGAGRWVGTHELQALRQQVDALLGGGR